MYPHHARNPAYFPKPQQLPFVRLPPGLNASARVPGSSGIPIAPPPGLNPTPRLRSASGIPMAPPLGITMLPLGMSLPQPLDIPPPQQSGIPQPQPAPSMPQAAPPNTPIDQEPEGSRRRVQEMIEAMNRETEQLKIDRNYQGILLSNGLLYTSCPRAWDTCDCEFCTQVRYIRQYRNLDAIGERLWHNPQYAFWREFPNIHEVKECKCERCAKVEEKEIKIPDNLGPDWNFWYGPCGRPLRNRRNGASALSDPEPLPPKFRAKPTETRDQKANTMLKGYFDARGSGAKPLFEMPNDDVQHSHNSAGAGTSNVIKGNGASLHPRVYMMPEESTADHSSNANGQYGVIGRPANKKANGFQNGTGHDDHIRRGPPR
ncbi:uncharacterized protein DFL_007888 [Arthrobotrys flagrans]|uniref:Uncharacterized protein n=1 Tax=Arthrobotrys flagrans TaxID=97331 RepID=A0A436ZWZ1_ARTFL|nr:hypothetical protein DFL_007888 [Arthrobotrys flagrans]